MTDIDTKELRRLMDAAHESGAGATTREYADYLIALDEAAPALLSEAEEAARLRELVCRAIPLIEMGREALFAGHSCGGRLVVEDEADELARDDIARIDVWLHDARALTTGGDDARD